MRHETSESATNNPASDPDVETSTSCPRAPTSEALSDALSKLATVEAERDALRVKAQALIAKLIEVHDHAAYEAVWGIAQLHLGPYTGPTYQQEMADLAMAFLPSPPPR